MQVSERRVELAGRVICITFSPPALLGRFERELELGFPVYGDPQRVAYAAFGLARGSLARVWLDPRVWWTYARLLAHGRRFGGVPEDSLQLGGDAVIDAAGRLRWVYRSRGPEDRPSIDRIRAVMAGL